MYLTNAERKKELDTLRSKYPVIFQSGWRLLRQDRDCNPSANNVHDTTTAIAASIESIIKDQKND